MEQHPRLGIILHVSGADLMDGTPVFDIKPYLPYVESHPGAAGGFTDQIERSRLAVEFPEELLEKITRILREMEDVELCGSFGEAIAAIQYVKENPVDIVFSDVVMPDISGITLASKIYQLPDPGQVSEADFLAFITFIYILCFL